MRGSREDASLLTAQRSWFEAMLILVHGGAGGWSRGGQPLIDAAMRACAEAAQAGLDAMRRGPAAGRGGAMRGIGALDAVEAAVRAMEDAPMLNAGTGALRNRDGDIELDAMIMDGATLGAGAVAAVRRVRNPVSLARRVMAETPHVLLVGEGASAFADTSPPGPLSAGGEGEKEGREGTAVGGRPTPPVGDDVAQAPSPARPDVSDTVGAVALDDAGNLAAATSTGGVPGKMAGRVGDSPIVGAGGYADNASAAVSATGDGEAFIKLAISKQACDYVALGMTAQAACDSAMALLAKRLPGTRGGLIAIDRAGRAGVAFNTEAMPWVLAASDGSVWSGWKVGLAS